MWLKSNDINLRFFFLKTKIMDSPEVLRVIDKLSAAGGLMHSLYNCDYAKFFVSLASVTDLLKLDRYFAPHVGFFCKEMRIKAYNQLLESYPLMHIANWRFLLSRSDEVFANKNQIRQQLLQAITENGEFSIISLT